MEIRKLSKTLSVAAQLRPEDIPAVAREGFGTVICNRPDNEEPGQPAADAMRVASEAAGLEFHYIPIASAQFTADKIAAFRNIRQQAKAPVLAYCRTGTRSATINALGNPEELPASEIISAAAAAGYDLSPLRARLEQTG